MMAAGGETEYLKYKRSRFTARLPLDRDYTRSHFWIQHREAEDYRVGFTRFATRMLGEVVEFGFEIEAGSEVERGQIIGWIEAFKAVSDIYCVVGGTFLGANPALDDDPDLIHSDPHGTGWLYAVRGEPEPDRLDAHGYSRILDEKIDQMVGERDAQHEQ